MITRRRFVAWAAAVVPVALVVRRADALGAEWIAAEGETLRALAEAVLPSGLGAAGAARAAADFQRWVDEYKEGAELNHGYGTSALRRTGASPRARWAAQLERLGQRTADGGRRFDAATLEQRRAIVKEELKGERLDRMPGVGAANHVAVALLAHWYGSSAAADLCYESRIGRQACRPLAQNARRPLPLAGGAR